MNAITDLQAGITQEDRAFRRNSGAASRATSLTAIRAFLEGAAQAALSTNALVAHGFGLVPKAAAVRR